MCFISTVLINHSLNIWWFQRIEYKLIPWAVLSFFFKFFLLLNSNIKVNKSVSAGNCSLNFLSAQLPTTLKLIFATILFSTKLIWPHKETRNKVSGPPLTKFTCPQTVQTGTFTKKKVLKRFGKSNAVMIRFGVRYSNWRPYSILVIGLLKYKSIEICHGSYSFDCLLKAIITVISKWVYRSP